jgi:hypothetical protein
MALVPPPAVPSTDSGRVDVTRERILAKVDVAVRTRLRGTCEAPRKAARIFKDYVLDLYFPANRLSSRERLRFAPLLLLVEYMVYKVDAVSEGAKGVDLEVTSNHEYVVLDGYKTKFESLLRRANAYNWSVARHMEMGERYVLLENKVTASEVVDHADVMRLAELRPSDVRLLHSMIFALRGVPCDDNLLNLLWPVEVLADIGNDLAHYCEDVSDGRFNTYAMFASLYGREAPERIRAEIARYERLFLAELATFPRAQQVELGALCARRYRSQTAVIPEVLPQPSHLSARYEEMR